MTFRKTIFWLHLACGVIGAVSIGIMCFTGTVLAFEKELAAWGERDARRIEAPAAGASRLSIEEAQRKLREAFPEARPATMLVTNDPGAAFAFPGARGTAGFYVNPHTGEVRQPQSTAVGGFMATMVTWHRYLGFTGAESRPRGKWINGACNLAFCLLAITGLYLWMPRNWSIRSVKAVALFNWRLAGKARDFNWHNAIGLWSAPILIVLTLTAVPISFQWGGRVINSLTGTPPPAAPAAGGPGGPAGAPGGRGGPVGPGAVGAGPAIEIPPPPPGTPLLSQDALVAAVQKEIPTWKTITVRVAGAEAGGPGGGGPAGRGPGRGARGGPDGAATAPTSTKGGPNAADAEGPGRGGRGARGEGRGGRGGNANAAGGAEARPASVQAATFTVRDAASWPRTANITVALNPYTGEVLRRTGYAELAPAAQVRAWTRFLHTGEALGFWGQFVAGLACAGGCVLVWTGLALAWRRFFGKSASSTPIAKTADEPSLARGAH